MLKGRHQALAKVVGSAFFCFLVCFTPSVAALDIGTYQILSTPFYDPSSDSVCSVVSSETGSGPLFGLAFPDVADPNALVARINAFISTSHPDSPLANLGASFVAAGQQHGVNPAMMVGLANKESSLGTANQPVVTKNHNSFGMTGVSGFPTVDGFAQFPSIEGSIDPATKYVGDNYVNSAGPHYSQSIFQMMQTYTPPSPKKDTQLTLDVMHKILDGIAETTGASNATASFTPGTTSYTQCSATSSYQAGANGYDLTGPNAMAHFYQCDPIWGQKSYGAGKDSICQSGCGITSMTMVVNTLAGAHETPLTMANQYGDRYHVTEGTDWGLWAAAAKDYGLNKQDIGTDLTKAASIIRQGGLVIISVGTGYFTTQSHLMVLRAVDAQGNFYLADPNGPNNPRNDENKPFTVEFLSKSSQGNFNHLFAFTNKL